MRIVVTGCAGFIGARISKGLLDAGHEVTGIDSLRDPRITGLTQRRLEDLKGRPGFTFYRVNFSEAEQLKSPPLAADVQHADAVLHLGALAGVRSSVENPIACYEVNVLGTLNLLEMCRQADIGKFILASTSSVYGAEVDGPVREDADSSRPLSPYAASKKAAETLLYSYHYLHGIDAVAFRYFTVYGPAGRPDMSVFRFIRNIAEEEPITVYGDGTQRRDFTFVYDIARGTVAALDVPGYDTINLGYGSPVVLNDVIELIEQNLGKRAKIGYQERHPADPMMTWADIGRAKEVLGWTPTVGIEEGVRRTVEWYKANREWARNLT